MTCQTTQLRATLLQVRSAGQRHRVPVRGAAPEGSPASCMGVSTMVGGDHAGLERVWLSRGKAGLRRCNSGPPALQAPVVAGKGSRSADRPASPRPRAVLCRDVRRENRLGQPRFPEREGEMRSDDVFPFPQSETSSLQPLIVTELPDVPFSC